MLLAVDCFAGIVDDIYPLHPVEDGMWAGNLYIGVVCVMYTIYFGY